MANRPIQGTQYTHTVALFDSNGDPITGATDSDVNVYYKKPGESTSTQKSLSSSDFFEIDSTNMAGLYGLVFSSSEMDVYGELIGSVVASGSTSLDIQQYNFRFTVVEVTNRDLEDAINSIELSGSGSGDSFPQNPTVQVENFPEHFVSEVKSGEEYTWEFRIVDPDGNPIKGITTSDISITVLSGGTSTSRSGSPQILSSSIDQTFTEVDPSGAPGWYSLTLETADTANLGDLVIDLDLSSVTVDQQGAEVQDTPATYDDLFGIFVRDLGEAFAVTERGGSEPAGQILDTADGGENWNVVTKLSNASGTTHEPTGYYDVDGLDGNAGEYAAIGVRALKSTNGGVTLQSTYNYGNGLKDKLLLNDELVDTVSDREVLFPLANSELEDRSWTTFLSRVKSNGTLVSNIAHWNQFTDKVNSGRKSGSKTFADVYALSQQENSASEQVLQSSQDVTQNAAVFNDTAAGFQRVVFEDETTGELVYIDNEGGSFGPRSIIDGTDNPGSPSILAWNTNTASPQLVVFYERAGTSDIYIAQYDFAGGTSVNDDSWLVNPFDDTAGFTRPEAVLDGSDNIHVTYVDSTRDNIYHQTNRTGSYVKSTVWSSGGTAKATYPMIAQNGNNPDGNVTIASAIATDGANTDEVRTFDEPDPASNSWPTTLHDSEGSVSEDEFGQQVDVSVGSSGSLYDLAVAYTRKNQNTADPPAIYNEGDNPEKIKDLSAFTGVVNVRSVPTNHPDETDYKYFYYQNNDVPVITHPTRNGWVERELTNDTDIQIPIGSGQMFGFGARIPSNLNIYYGPHYALGVDNVTDNDLHFYELDTSASDTVIAAGADLSNDPDTIYIEQTVDGGFSWSSVIFPSLEGRIERLDFTDTNEGYAVTDQGHVLQTTDGGGNWSEVTQIANTFLNGVWNTAPGEVSVVGYDKDAEAPAHYVSTDGGSTFDRFTETENVSNSDEFHSIDGQGDECWISAENGEIIHCFKTVTFSGGRKFRFQVVARYEEDTYSLVDQVKGTVDDTNTKVTETQANVDTVETKVDDLDSDVQTVDSTVDDTNTKVSEIQNNVDTVENKIDNLDTDTTEILNGLERVLGLQGENYRAKNYSFDPETGKLQSVDWVLYSSASDAQNDQNPIAEYSIDITLDANGEPSEYVATRTS